MCAADQRQGRRPTLQQTGSSVQNQMNGDWLNTNTWRQYVSHQQQFFWRLISHRRAHKTNKPTVSWGNCWSSTTVSTKIVETVRHLQFLAFSFGSSPHYCLYSCIDALTHSTERWARCDQFFVKLCNMLQIRRRTGFEAIDIAFVIVHDVDLACDCMEKHQIAFAFQFMGTVRVLVIPWNGIDFILNKNKPCRI